MYQNKRIRCDDCGEDQDLSYILWEDRRLCAVCFAQAVSGYVSSDPFLFAGELGLDIIQVPERRLAL